MYENFLGNKTAWKILRLLTEVPGRATSRKEIKDVTKAGNFAISLALEKLLTYRILSMKKIGKREVYWLNLANPVTKTLLQLFDLEREKLKGLEPSKVVFLAKVIEKIDKLVRPKRIILFGSYTKGTATEESDFDLCVIVEKKTVDKKLRLAKLPENVEVHLYEEKEFEELRKERDKLVEEIIINGIELLNVER